MEEIYERLGKPQTQDLSNLPESSRPRYTVNAVNMKGVHPRWLSDQIMIIDFGIAFLQDQSSPDIGTPIRFCAPEFLFGDTRTVSSDIWALGCTLFEIRTGASLFRYKGRPSRNQVLISIVKLLGDLPEKWWSEWEEGRKSYTTETDDDNGLAQTVPGSLFDQIMQIGIHDGTHHPGNSSHNEESTGYYSVGDTGKKGSGSEEASNTRSRMIALVEELTSSEAADVLVRVSKI